MAQPAYAFLDLLVNLKQAEDDATLAGTTSPARDNYNRCTEYIISSGEA